MGEPGTKDSLLFPRNSLDLKRNASFKEGLFFFDPYCPTEDPIANAFHLLDRVYGRSMTLQCRRCPWVDVQLRNEDLRIDTYRSGGAGGQSVNTTSSAVRITHIPTGIAVAIQDERSQHMNKAKALKVLRARLYELERSRLHRNRSKLRSEQVGSGDRSERIRTYNFPQGRVTDHRIGFTHHSIEDVMDGESLDVFIDALLLQEEMDAISSIATQK